jgi:hypothetical protein
MPEELTSHLPDCEIATFELCTCGLGARQRELEAAQVTAAYRVRAQAEAREEETRYRTSAKHLRWQRFWKTLILGFVGALGFSSFPVFTGIVLSLYLAGKHFMWLLEAYGPLYSDSRLRGLTGWFRFMFW